MPSITVRDLPADAYEELAARAAKSGHSLPAYLRDVLIDLASRPDAAVLLGRVRDQKRRARVTLPPEVILRHRDAGRQ